jgi:hypothetical protein
LAAARATRPSHKTRRREDGQTFVDDSIHGTTLTDRDPDNVVISEFAGDANTPPVVARRIGV